MLACLLQACTAPSTHSPTDSPLFPHPILIPRIKVPQLPREGDELLSIVWTGVDQWEQSNLCAGGILTSLALLAFEPCRRVRPLPLSSSISTSPFILALSLPHRTN